MEFRLIYQGVLRASGDMAEKHEIRKQFNGQLRQLWNVHPGLSRWMQEVAAADGRTGLQLITEEHGGFAPLVTEEWALACELEILFLRREGPGHIVTSGGGDIDNRIKVLFDALRKPQHREVRPLARRRNRSSSSLRTTR